MIRLLFQPIGSEAESVGRLQRQAVQARPLTRAAMWKFTTAWDSDKHPLLHSLNGNVGRQVWVWDAQAGTPEERAKVEQLRAQFAENRLKQKHSADELLR